MAVIYKYQLHVIGKQTVSVPVGARILTAQDQGGCICLWAECPQVEDMELREITVVGTGHDDLPSGLRYVATVQIGVFVWHVYEGSSNQRTPRDGIKSLPMGKISSPLKGGGHSSEARMLRIGSPPI